MPRPLALEILGRVRKGRVRARDALDRALAASRMKVPDRALAREIVLGVLRARGSLDALIGHVSNRPLDEIEPTILDILRMGAYQIAYLDRVPDHAAVSRCVDLAKGHRGGRGAGFVNALLRRLPALFAEEPGPGLEPWGCGGRAYLASPVFPDRDDDPVGYQAARWSHPRWLVERLLEQHGEADTSRILVSGIERPLLSIRPCTGHEDDVLDALGRAQVSVEREGRCLLASRAGQVDELPGWREGWFAVQGPTAAEVVPALDVAPGAAVLDLCAAPGGKTLELAERVGPEGLVLAVDNSPPRLDLLRREIARRGLSQVALLVADVTDPGSIPSGLRDRLAEGFDAVLLDVPCSNTGVLGRRPEARWRLEGPERIEMLAEQAAHMLLVAAQKVRPGGRLAYSTCSIDRTENHDVVRGFLEEDAEFSLGSETLTLPESNKRDGGFCAVFSRAGDA